MTEPQIDQMRLCMVIASDLVGVEAQRVGGTKIVGRASVSVSG